jgi:hypothetical protein
MVPAVMWEYVARLNLNFVLDLPVLNLNANGFYTRIDCHSLSAGGSSMPPVSFAQNPIPIGLVVKL